MTGRGSTHIDTAFMGLTSCDGVTVDCKLPARCDDPDMTHQEFVRRVDAIRAGSRRPSRQLLTEERGDSPLPDSEHPGLARRVIPAAVVSGGQLRGPAVRR